MSGGYQNLAGRVESGQEVFGISWDGSGRAGSGRVEISRVVWSQVRRCLEIMERVGSGRVGSGRVGSGRVGSGRVGSGRVGSGRVGSSRVRSSRVRRFSNLAGRAGLS